MLFSCFGASNVKLLPVHYTLNTQKIRKIERLSHHCILHIFKWMFLSIIQFHPLTLKSSLQFAGKCWIRNRFFRWKWQTNVPIIHNVISAFIVHSNTGSHFVSFCPEWTINKSQNLNRNTDFFQCLTRMVTNKIRVRHHWPCKTN